MSKFARALVIGVILFIVVLLGASLLVFVPFGWARGFGWGMLGRGMMGGFASPFWFMGGFGMLLFWVLIIGGVIWLVQAGGRGAGAGGTAMAVGESPLDTLRVKRRYAKGEISKEQFEDMKRDLG